MMDIVDVNALVTKLDPVVTYFLFELVLFLEMNKHRNMYCLSLST